MSPLVCCYVFSWAKFWVSFAAVIGSLVYLEVLYNLLPSYLRVAMYTVM